MLTYILNETATEFFISLNDFAVLFDSEHFFFTSLGI